MRLIIFSILIIVGCSSCRKNFACKCSKVYSNGTAPPIDEYSEYSYKDSRKKAEDKCNENTTSGTDTYGTYNVTCQIQ